MFRLWCMFYTIFIIYFLFWIHQRTLSFTAVLPRISECVWVGCWSFKKITKRKTDKPYIKRYCLKCVCIINWNFISCRLWCNQFGCMQARILYFNYSNQNSSHKSKRHKNYSSCNFDCNCNNFWISGIFFCASPILQEWHFNEWKDLRCSFSSLSVLKVM